MNEHKLIKHHSSNRIIEEVTDDSTIDAMGKFNNDLDIKYELFCKWLQQNDNGVQLSDEIDGRNFCNIGSGPTLTEDEVSSFATNSDDSTNDIFLDTESEQPIIMVNGMLEMPNTNAIAAAADVTIDTTEFRANTPSQLSVSDYDCSSSDVTVNSTGKANGNSKRKPKHKKGRAPPIPTAATEINSNNAENDAKSTNLARETDI